MRKLKPRGRNDPHIFDYSKITDKIYIGSDLCKGRDCLEHSAEFKSLGVSVELNLSAEKKEIPPDDIDVYSWIPVVDGYAPSPKQLDVGSSIINAAVKNGDTVYLKKGEDPDLVGEKPIKIASPKASTKRDREPRAMPVGIYVHCKNGHGRSPTMVAAYLIRFKGTGLDKAIDFIAKKRPEIHIEKTQRKALKAFQDSLTG